MASAAGIKAGRAFVELGVNSRKLVSGLRNASKKLKAFGAGVRNMGLKIAGLGVALAAPFAIATKVFMSMGDTIGKMSARTGMAVEALSGLEYAASQSGTSIETLEKGLMRMSRVTNDARMGLKSAQDALSLVGLTSADIEGMSPEDTFKLMAQRISEIEDPMKKAAAAQMLFGRAGAEMIPFLNQGAAGIEEMMAKAEELGLVMSAEDAKSAEELTDAFDTLWRTMKSGLFKVGAALAPMISDIVEKIVEVASVVSKWIDENRSWVVMAAQVVAGIIAFGLTITGLGVGIIAAGYALSILSGVIGFIVSPIGIAILAIVGISAVVAKAIYWFLNFTETGKWMKEKIMAVFGKIAEHAHLMFGGIKDALVAGEWKLAAKIMWAGIKQPFVSGWNWLKDGWISAKLVIVQTFSNMWNAMAKVASKTWGWMKKRWIDLKNVFGAGIDTEAAYAEIDKLTEQSIARRDKDADAASSARARQYQKDLSKIQEDERRNREELVNLRQEAAEKRAAREAEMVEDAEEPEKIPPPEAPELPSAPPKFAAASAAAVARMGQVVERKVQEQQLSALRKIEEHTEAALAAGGAEWTA